MDQKRKKRGHLLRHTLSLRRELMVIIQKRRWLWGTYSLHHEIRKDLLRRFESHTYVSSSRIFSILTCSIDVYAKSPEITLLWSGDIKQQTNNIILS